MPILARLLLVALCAIIVCVSTLHAVKATPTLSKKNEEDSRDEFRKLKQYSKGITKDINKRIAHFLASTNVPLVDGLR